MPQVPAGFTSHQLTLRIGLASLACVASLATMACSAPGSTPPPGAAVNNNQSSGVSQDAGPLALPFVVSSVFTPSGFMGDSQTDYNGIQLSNQTSRCLARQPNALGDCYTINWTPTFVMGQKTAWVGVYWQYPADNWGMLPGHAIAPGATKVTFLAAGAAGGEDVVFIVGGVNNPSTPAGGANSDPFKEQTEVTLTKSWAPYEISLSSSDSYSSVIGGFAWSITTSSTAPVTFYIDDIEWQATPAAPATDAGQ